MRGIPNDDRDARADAELIAAANRGDRDSPGAAEAFETLYLRHRDWVTAVAMRFTRDPDLALDAMQDTFLELLTRFPGFVLTSQLRTFLYPIAKHTVLARLRRQRMAGAAAGGPDPAGVDRPPNETRDELMSSVQRLPDRQREVLILRFADDLALHEIARALEVPLGTVKSRLHAALAAIRPSHL